MTRTTRLAALLLAASLAPRTAHALGHKHPTPTPDPGKSKPPTPPPPTAPSNLPVPGRQAPATDEPEPRHVMPVKIHSPFGGYRSATWDARVFVNVGAGGWALKVFRPEAVRTDNSGVPLLDAGGTMSDEYPLEKNDEGGMGDHNNLGLAAHPDTLGGDNPFRSDRDGNPNRDGAYECYDVDIHTTYYHPPGDHDKTGMRRMKIVVKNPRTKDAAIEQARILEPFQDLTTTTGQKVYGIEPTVSFDGRLLVFQGSPKNNGDIDILMYSWNATPGSKTGWSTPRCVVDMYHVDRDVLVDGIPFHERFPIAKEPMKSADGTVYPQGSILHGAYPWISQDATELFFCAVAPDGHPTADNDGARRRASSVIGRWTNFTVRQIDGPINPNRFSSTRFNIVSPGASHSFWEPYRGSGAPIPYTASRPVFPVFGSTTDDYNDVSFEDFVDGEYVLALRMNEVITSDGHYDTQRTPDTSGRGNTGLLEGATFPQEHDGTDANQGAVGQAIYFGDKDLVRVKSPASVRETKGALTVQMFVKRLVDLHKDGENHFKFLLNQPGAFDLILEDDGSIQASVTTGSGEHRSGGLGSLPVGEWVNVAFTFDSANGKLRTFVRGRLEGEQSFAPGELVVSSQDLLVGPAGQTPDAGGGQAIVMIDELLISRVARTDQEIARGAYADPPPPSFANASLGRLPRGLDPKQLRVPASNPVNGDAVELGKMLFFEKRLSVDGSISCATCHDPQKTFADGLAIAQGLHKKVLKRNTPTILNRALSTGQFWDGRSGSLEDQALQPIQNADEMGNTIDGAVSFLRSKQEYVDRFRRAFNADPSPDTLGRALASFQRTLLTGDSAADRYAAGDHGALSDGELRGRALFEGKARCVACHSGSNFTDERFHDTAQGQSQDDGRFAASGRTRDRGAFKTPSLRDVSETAPYLHDGSAASLEDVVDLYDKGGRTADGRDFELRPLGLSDQEKSDLVSFLRALRGSVPQVAPPPLPQ